MMNIKNILVYVIIYVLFILGISILSEWMCCKLRKTPRLSSGYISSLKYHEQKLDNILEQFKHELKNEYFFKFKQYMNSMNSMNSNIDTHKEHYQNLIPSHYDNYDTYHTSNEDEIMQQVNKKLQQGNHIPLDLHASGRQTLGQSYSKVDGWIPEKYPHTQANLYKKYKQIPREINWQDPAHLVIPPKDSYNIDMKYKFHPSNENISQEDYNFTQPKLNNSTHTFLDEKYSPQNYKIKPNDGSTPLYSVFK